MIVIVMLSYLGLLWVCYTPPDQNAYVAASFDKMKRMQELPSPKMILVGGSNLAFGINSEKMQVALGMPVVNMGLDAGLGLKFMLDQVKPFLIQGDVIVIAPEYDHFTGNLFSGSGALIKLIEINHDWSKLADISMITLANNLMSRNQTIFGFSRSTPRISDISKSWDYSRAGFNSFGDEIAHLSFPNEKFKEDGPVGTNINLKAIRYLKNFIDTNVASGISVLVFYPCISKSYYSHNLQSIETVTKALGKNIFMPLTTPENFVYDDDLFFNTSYHLNAQGRQLHTANMLQALKGKVHNK